MKRDLEPYEVLGMRTVTKRGGSYQVTIPKEVGKILNLSDGDQIVFYKESGRISFSKATKLRVRFSPGNYEEFDLTKK